MQRIVGAAVFVFLVSVQQGHPQTFSLPSVDGVTVFYRAGRAASSDLRVSPTAPCADRSSSLPMCGWGFETVYQLAKTHGHNQWGAELAVGYDFLTLGGKLGSSHAYDLHGSIQTLPSITLYLSRDI